MHPVLAEIYGTIIVPGWDTAPLAHGRQICLKPNAGLLSRQRRTCRPVSVEKRAAVPRIVPHGLEPEGHWEASTSVVETTLDIMPPLALSARFAVDTVAEYGPAIDGVGLWHLRS